MSTTKSVHYLNGKFVEEKDLLISPRDIGFSRGYAVFDFLVTYGGRPFMLGAHLDRLYNSAKLVGLNISMSKKELHNAVLKTLAANNYPLGRSASKSEKSIKVAVSGGIPNAVPPVGLPTKGNETVIIMVDDVHLLPRKMFDVGAHYGLVKFRRYTPQAKTNDYTEAMIQIQKGQRTHQIEPIYYDDTQVYEASTSNVFALVGGELLTPKSNVLGGVTRDVLLKILKLKIPVKKADFKLEDLRRATEVFITASNKDILPVTKLAGKKVGNGKVGPVTKECMRQFTEFVQSNKW